jgi:hypothetical protein
MADARGALHQGRSSAACGDGRLGAIGRLLQLQNMTIPDQNGSSQTDWQADSQYAPLSRRGRL